MQSVKKKSFVVGLVCFGLVAVAVYSLWTASKAPGPTFLESRECAKTRPYPGTEAPFVYWTWDTFYAPEDESIWRATGYRNWFSTFLCAMGEASLTPNDSKEALRFLYLRSFDPGLAIRVEKSGSQVRLTSIMLEGSPTLEPGRVAQRQTRDLSPEEWDNLQQILEHSDFWNLPTNKRISGAMDGAQWIVEATRSGQHHVVDRWSGDELETMGLRLLELSGLEVGDVY